MANQDKCMKCFGNHVEKVLNILRWRILTLEPLEG